MTRMTRMTRFASTVSLVALLAGPAFAQSASVDGEATADPDSGVTGAQVDAVTDSSDNGDSGNGGDSADDGPDTGDVLGTGPALEGQDDEVAAETADTPHTGRFAEVLTAADTALVAGSDLNVVSNDGQVLGTVTGPVIESEDALVMRVQLDPALGVTTPTARLRGPATLDGDGQIAIAMTQVDFVSAINAQVGATPTDTMQDDAEASDDINLDMPDEVRNEPGVD
ncbi:MAG: hypothetical protein ACXIVG_11440 [Pararhodobacter sp.]